MLSCYSVSASPFEATTQEADTITVDRIAIRTEVVDREPEGAGTEFDTTVEALYCFTELNGPEGMWCMSGTMAIRCDSKSRSKKAKRGDGERGHTNT